VTAWSLLCALCLVAAVLVWRAEPSGRLVLRAVELSTAGRPSAVGPSTRRAGSAMSPTVRRLAAGCLAIVVLLLVPAPLGWLLAGPAAAGLDGWLARQPSRAEIAAAGRMRRQLPLALELMAAALTSGATTSAAVALSARACGSPISRPLLEVEASLELGAAPDEAWRPVLATAALHQLGRLALRSTASGAAMAGACRELAGREREAAVVEAQVAIKRAGVLTVLPLALCFLPSFVLVGVAPIIVGLLRSLAL
jgi:Flp pilus assembly protein TadB